MKRKNTSIKTFPQNCFVSFITLLWMSNNINKQSEIIGATSVILFVNQTQNTQNEQTHTNIPHQEQVNLERESEPEHTQQVYNEQTHQENNQNNTQNERNQYEQQQTQNQDKKMSLEEAAQILGISIQPTQKELKKAYRELINKWHPDRNQNNLEEAKEKMLLIIEAYNTMKKHIENKPENITTPTQDTIKPDTSTLLPVATDDTIVKPTERIETPRTNTQSNSAPLLNLAMLEKMIQKIKTSLKQVIDKKTVSKLKRAKLKKLLRQIKMLLKQCTNTIPALPAKPVVHKKPVAPLKPAAYKKPVLPLKPFVISNNVARQR